MKNLMATEAKKEPMVTQSPKDPMCIDYWIDNELDFGRSLSSAKRGRRRRSLLPGLPRSENL